jgi:sugar lactone lactonase YvrE
LYARWEEKGMNTRRLSVLTTIAALWSGALPAAGDFIPGYLYVSDAPPKPCGIGGFRERVWEVNPTTGAARVFAEVPVPLCGAIWKVAFTPDGEYLRVSMPFGNTVVEIDGNGQATLALSGANGLRTPSGLAYGADESFFVVNSINIVRFPAGSTQPTVFAGRKQGVRFPGAIALAPDGDVYYGSLGQDRKILRFSPTGEPTFFDSWPGPGSVLDLAVDSQGTLYALSGVRGGELYRYAQGDPAARKLFASGFMPGVGSTSLVLSPDERTVFVGGNGVVVAVDTFSGAARIVNDRLDWAGAGIAYYVPEPSTLVALLTGTGAAVCTHAGRRSA